MCFHGCASHEIPENIPQAVNSVDAPQVVDSEESVRQLAIQKFDEVRGQDKHLEYKITVKEKPEEWIIFFDGKVPMPGNHALVYIDKGTGTIKYAPGE